MATAMRPVASAARPQQLAEVTLQSQGVAFPVAQINLNGCVAPRACNSLNTNPFNTRAEELALLDCTVGVEVRRLWTEQEMVRSFGGQMSPGTPDGMFESWDGELTCVQVVRVPLLKNSDVLTMQNTVAQTVITKVIKSQSWLRFTQAMPSNFVIFCWLPHHVPQEVLEHAELLMERIRVFDRRFSLRLRTPAEPGAIFPSGFATHHEARVKSRNPGFTESDISSLEDFIFEQEEDDGVCWDITWCWDTELPEWFEDAQEMIDDRRGNTTFSQG
eukprot:TRINITY_DN75952_c0_g1_i1.p1 TRINITY_DN75952_c0_g1~~TRINITY_DN75952_c0_g1_i1.p1  ORF type:complete len:274 (+),score=52.13 TRINITY_DN75952_c0_g1_i1:198-1019(+)